MYVEEDKSVIYKLSLTLEEVRRLKGLVQNPPEDAGTQERAFCEDLFNTLSNLTSY